MAKIDTLFPTKTAKKPYSLELHIPIEPIYGSSSPGPITRIMSPARAYEVVRMISRGHFFYLAVFFRDMHDGLGKRTTTLSLPVYDNPFEPKTFNYVDMFLKFRRYAVHHTWQK